MAAASLQPIVMPFPIRAGIDGPLQALKDLRVPVSVAAAWDIEGGLLHCFACFTMGAQHQ
jgi:hypothetical protein